MEHVSHVVQSFQTHAAYSMKEQAGTLDSERRATGITNGEKTKPHWLKYTQGSQVSSSFFFLTLFPPSAFCRPLPAGLSNCGKSGSNSSSACSHLATAVGKTLAEILQIHIFYPTHSTSNLPEADQILLQKRDLTEQVEKRKRLSGIIA